MSPYRKAGLKFPSLELDYARLSLARNAEESVPSSKDPSLSPSRRTIREANRLVPPPKDLCPQYGESKPRQPIQLSIRWSHGTASHHLPAPRTRIELFHLRS